MRWTLRIISGLALMTAPYIWTVGQVGLETANRNICDLLTAALPWGLPTCRFHFVYFWLWVLGLLAAASFLIFDSGQWIKKTAAPYGGVLLFYGHFHNVAATRIKSIWRKVEPSHIIILGLVIALCGVIWQMRKPLKDDPRIAQLQSQLAVVQAKPAAGASSTVAPNNSMLSGRPVSGREVVERLERLEKEHSTTVSELAATKEQLERKKQELDSANTVTQLKPASVTQTGNTLQERVAAYLAKKNVQTSDPRGLSNLFSVKDNSDGKGVFISTWNEALDVWPTIDDGFSPAEIRRFPQKAPNFTLPSDKKRFREAIDELSVLVNDKIGSKAGAVFDAFNVKPLVAKNQGRSAIDALRKLQEIESIKPEIIASLFTNGQGKFFDQFPKYKPELLGLMPEGSTDVWDAYSRAQSRLTNSLMVARQAEKHPEDGELFEYAMNDLERFQNDFLTATNQLKVWVQSVNDRIDRIAKAI